MVTDMRLQLAYETGTFTFSQLNFNADTQDLFSLAAAFNSIQEEQVREIRKIVRSILL